MGSLEKHLRVQQELDSGERVTVHVEFKYAVTEDCYNKFGLYNGVEIPAMPHTKTVVKDAINLVKKIRSGYYKLEIVRAGLWDFGDKRCEHCNGLGKIYGKGFYVGKVTEGDNV